MLRPLQLPTSALWHAMARSLMAAHSHRRGIGRLKLKLFQFVEPQNIPSKDLVIFTISENSLDLRTDELRSSAKSQFQVPKLRHRF